MDEIDTDFLPGKTTASAKPPRSTEAPRYYLITAQYINDSYYAADIEIIYRGTPNEGMEPRNAAAEEAMQEWIDSLPSKPMRHEDFIMKAMMDRPKHEMGEKPTGPKKRAARLMGKETPETDNTVEVVPPDLTRVKNPKKQMGTIVQEVPSPGSI